MIHGAVSSFIASMSLLAGDGLSGMEIALRLSPVVATLIAAGIALAVFVWNRNETRRRILTDVLRHFVRNYYFLDRCNTTRRTRELLIRSFTSEEEAGEARARVEMLMERYSASLEKATEAHVNLEAEIACNSFRFDEHTRQLLKAASTAIAGLGAAVNDGRFDEADIESAKIKDLHEKLGAVARSLRVSRQIKHFLKRDTSEVGASKTSDPNFALSKERLKLVMRLVHKRITTQAGTSFKIYAPRTVVEDPDVLDKPDLVTRLKDQTFHLRFQDGTDESLSLVELLAFVYELVFIKHHETEVLPKLNVGELALTEVKITSRLDIDEITSPAVAKALLEKVVFSIDSPTEIPQPPGRVSLQKSA